jgi:hypothetical protein
MARCRVGVVDDPARVVAGAADDGLAAGTAASPQQPSRDGGRRHQQRRAAQVGEQVQQGQPAEQHPPRPH